MQHLDVTELFDRDAAIDRLADVLDLTATDTTTAVAVVDIDRLADVNDALGHDVGDRLVGSTARRLAGAIDPGDVIARTGDDEFVVVCSGLADDAAATEFGDRIRRALSGRLTLDDVELDVSVSVGVAVAGPAAFDSERPSRRRAQEIVSQAHIAMRAAKQRGRARTVRFGDELAQRTRIRTELAAALARAVRDDQLELEFQPIFTAVGETAEAAEALLRWRHPTYGWLEAREFIDVAEQTGAIVAIGDWALDHACAALRSLLDEGRVAPGFSVHVNTARLQLGDPGVFDRIRAVLRDHRLEPHQLVLEVRGSSLVDHDAVQVVRSMRALRQVGVRLAIDNFATGSDALSLVTDLGADVLKLDGTFALPADTPDGDMGVVRAVVQLAHALGMVVVAERVTSIEQLRRLRAAGCDLVQGMLLAPPTGLSRLSPQMER